MAGKLILAAAAALLGAHSANAADPIVLKLTYPSTPSPPFTDGMRPWAENLEKETDGAVKVQLFVGPGVANMENVYHRTVEKVIDMGYGTMGTVGGRFLRAQVCNLPFSADNAIEASVVTWRMYANGVTAEDFADAKPLALFTFGSSVMHTTRPITSAADLKGVKMGSASKPNADSLVLLGAAPVTITPPEYYQTVQRGLAIGVPVSWSGLMSFKIYEVAKYHLETPFGLAPAFLVMNKEVFAKLPDGVRAAIDRTAGETLSRTIGTAGHNTDEANKAKVREMPGHVISRLAPDERERWRKTLQPITDEWVKATPDGAKVLAAFRAEVDKFRREAR